MSVNVELARTFLWAQQIRKEHTYLLARFDEVKGHQAQQDERVQVSLEENHRRFDAYTKVFNDKVETAEGRQAHLIADLASVVAAYRASNNELQQQHNVLKERLNSLEQVVGSLQHAPQGSRTDGRMTDSQFEFDHPRAPDATLSMIRDVPSLVARGQQARLPYVSLFGAAENSCASQELPRLSQIHNAGNATPIQLTRVRSPNLDASQPAGPATPSTVVSPVPSPLTINKTKVNTLQLSMPYTLGPSPADGLSPLYSRRTDDPSQVTDVAGLCSLVSESQSKVAAESRTPAPIIEIPDSLAEKADKTDKTLENEALAKFQPKRKRNKKKWNPIPSRFGT